MKTQLTIADLKLMVEDELLRLAAGKRPDRPQFGICKQLHTSFFKSCSLDSYYLVPLLSKGWVHYTGRWNYPVPGDYNSNYPWSGYAGCYRRNLCEYLAVKVRACSDEDFMDFLN